MPMPQPGDPYASAFIAEVEKCCRVVHDYNGQAAHCAEPTIFTGRWYSPRDDGTYWRVWSCVQRQNVELVLDADADALTEGGSNLIVRH